MGVAPRMVRFGSQWRRLPHASPPPQTRFRGLPSNRGISSTSSPDTGVLQVQPQAADAFNAVAHSSLEDGLAMILSPTQLGVQLWEVAHASTGLPWWAAIPVATVGVRTMLMPLSLRAYAASSYLALLHRAFGLSREVGDAVAEAEATERRQRGESAGSASVSEGSAVAGETSASSSGSSPHSTGRKRNAAVVDGARALGRMELVRHVVAHLHKGSNAPSLSWYVANGAVQVRARGLGPHNHVPFR